MPEPTTSTISVAAEVAIAEYVYRPERLTPEESVAGFAAFYAALNQLDDVRIREVYRFTREFAQTVDRQSPYSRINAPMGALRKILSQRGMIVGMTSDHEITLESER